MTRSNNESEPLLRGSVEENNNSYNGVSVRSIDEEEVVSSSSSSETTIDVHDAVYLVKNRLGKASLTMVTFW
jgi:hypothetical protein